MSDDANLYAAVAAGVLGAEASHRDLLQSIVEVAMAIFEARASSVFLYDEQADELVFEAVAGEGSDSLVGRRYPSDTGIAGWVLATRQPAVVEDLAGDERFAREVAESTGYLPEGLMAVPLVHGERTLGVLEVLDRPQAKQFTLGEMGLLSLFASQAAIALDLLQHARRARLVLLEHDGDAAVVARLGAAVASLDEQGRESGIELLSLLADVLRARRRVGR
jgi:GAF domain-containing protein